MKLIFTAVLAVLALTAVPVTSAMANCTTPESSQPQPGRAHTNFQICDPGNIHVPPSPFQPAKPDSAKPTDGVVTPLKDEGKANPEH